MTSYVQYNGSFDDVESKYPSLTLWADGDNRVFFEENGEKQYLEVGDYVVLDGGKHIVSKQKPEEDKPAPKAKKEKEESETTTTVSGPVDDTTKDKK